MIEKEQHPAQTRMLRTRKSKLDESYFAADKLNSQKLSTHSCVAMVNSMK
jgi:hypothetical protein